jgi:YHS domain-containing protein
MLTFISRRGATVAALSLLALAAAQPAAQSTRPAAVFNATRGVALDGYDVVAYFAEGRPVKGSPSFAHAWEGTTWHFASAAHRDAFAAAPAKYAPQFGGFCAYGVSRGYAVDIDPDAWTIVEGRLYLNYSKSVQRTWDKARASYIQKAEANWPAVAAKQAGKE